jgi:hypothetical protein
MEEQNEEQVIVEHVLHSFGRQYAARSLRAKRHASTRTHQGTGIYQGS